MKPPYPNPRKASEIVLTPDIVEARRITETLERQIVFGAVKSYRFYLSIKDAVAPYDPEKVTHRLDFSVDRFNVLWRFVAAYYQRFSNTELERDEFIPNPVLAAYVIDTSNKSGMAIVTAEELVKEITAETEFTTSLTYETSTALAQSPAFADWLSSRILEQTAGSIASMRSLGMLTLDKVEEMIAAARESLSRVGTNGSEMARPLGEFEIPAEDDPSELIGPHRFLCREAVATLVGPSGIGKSTLAMQMAIGFALGTEIFGFKPRTALKILIIQGENDDGDIAEMRDGAVAGLGLTEEQKATVSASVLCCRCNSSTGRKFVQETVRKNLQRFSPDLLIIDPALCYIGGDTKEQRIVGEFLRTFLLPELRRANCGCLLLHHTNKPPTQNPKGGVANEDAYPESGSAEFRNVARAVISLKPIGDGSVFELRVPKRGNRLGWTDDSGHPTTRKYIRHSEDRNQLFWEASTEDDAHRASAAVQDNKSESIAEKVLACIGRHDEISQKDLLAEAKKLGIGNKACREAVEGLLEDSRVHCTEKPRPGARPAKFYSPAVKTSIPGGGR